MNPTAVAWMLVAIACELVGTTSLKLTQGGKRPAWYVAVAIGYAIAFVLFSRALRMIPLGIAYAIWAGLGIIGSAIIGAALFHERLSPVSLAGVAVVLIGIALLNLGMTAAPAPG